MYKVVKTDRYRMSFVEMGITSDLDTALAMARSCEHAAIIDEDTDRIISEYAGFRDKVTLDDIK